ncbi:MAG TPA: nucleotidyltransferase domain-containing protein [Planctomycetota bacterium]|nr:nucleotidyltransferase domain-containing protein [Planctomycetota bacterium]
MVSGKSGAPAIDLEAFARELPPVASRHPEIVAVWIFGSAVRGALRFDSDFDVAVLFAAGTQARDQVLAAFAARLEALTVPFPVDAVDLAEQGVIFAHEVLCTGRLVFEADRERRARFEATTCVRAFDFLPTHELAVRGQREGLLRRLEQRR